MSARAFAALLLAVAVARLWLAHRWGLLADEAYHWTWALAPAWGYHDQPPLIAWVLAAERAVFGDHALALRAGPITLVLAAIAALAPWARDRGVWALWALGAPAMWFLGSLAIPDALLIAAWGGSLAAALAGGRAWVLAGALAGAAAMSKHTGLLLFPLLLLAADPAERRTRWPWFGGIAALAVFAPNLWWNATHGFETFRFQLAEGLTNPRAPGAWGPWIQLRDQVLLVGPVGAGAAVAWAVGAARGDRVQRLCFYSSVPVSVAFALAAVGGPPEAQWTGPVWLGIGLGLSRSEGRIHRAAAVGGWLAAGVTALLLLQVERPVLRLPADPATRFTEVQRLGDAVGRWALPTGVAAREPGAQAGLPVLTERYQEAASIRWSTGLPARVLPGCGRWSEDQRAPFVAPPAAIFVRPTTGGPPRCAEAWYGQVRGPHPVREVDARGRRVGPWDLFELAEPR